MLTALKFVQGSVAKKDFVPALTHFRIEDNTVRGFNGTLALCSPIPFDIACSPKGEPLVKAIALCSDTVQLTLTPAGRLSIKSGRFKAFVDCIEGDTPHALPEGDPVDINGDNLLAALKAVAPFVGEDASRPWANGVLLLGQSAFATNNVTLVEYWIGSNIPHPLNIPRAAVREMLRIGEAPIGMQVTANSITFHYNGSRWLRTQLYETGWPDLRKVLDRPSNPAPINAELFDALEAVKPFTDKLNTIRFADGNITTHVDPTEGAHYELDNFPHEGIYRLEMLQLLQGNAVSIDWSTYPAPCMWFGERMRGAIIGMRP